MSAKRLYRSDKDRIIAGVCGGIAEYFNIDSAIVRLGFVFIIGINIIFYLIALLIIPKRSDYQSQTREEPTNNAYVDNVDNTENYININQSNSYNNTDYDDYSYNHEPKKLYRSQTNRVVGGVCGGLAEYTNIDPTVFRVLLILLSLAYGGGVIAYIVAWVIIPEKNIV